MNITQRQLGLVLVVVGLVTSVAVPALAASPVFDSETTDTSTQSEIVDGYTVNGFDANASNESRIEVEVDSTNPLIKFIAKDTSREVARLGPSSLNQTFSNSTSSTYYYGTNVSHDTFANVVVDPNESQKIKTVVVNNTSASTTDTTNATFTLQTVDNRTVRRIDSEDTLTLDDGFTIDNFGLNLSLSSATASYSEDSIPISGDNGTLRVAVANSTAVDRFDASVGDLDAGAAAWSVPLTLDGKPVPVYVDSKADSHADGYSYGIYDTDADAVTVHFGDNFEGDDNVDVSMTGNAGILERFQHRISVNLANSGIPGVDMLVGFLFGIDRFLGLTIAGFGAVLGRRGQEV